MLVQEIHGTLAAHSHLVTNYRPCARSAYASIKRSELVSEKVRIIRSRLREMVAETDAAAGASKQKCIGTLA